MFNATDAFHFAVVVPSSQTRLQAPMPAVAVPETLLEKWNFAGTCGPECVRIYRPSLPPSACGPACEPVPYRGTLHALRSIAQKEGVAALWRGTDLALLMSIPMVGVYLPLYDYLVESMRRSDIGAYSPLLAGTLARTAAVYATAPFELLRTRMQAARTRPAPVESLGYQMNTKNSKSSEIFRHLTTAKNGKLSKYAVARGLWTGVGATLARDVPFSALYWALAESIRGNLMPEGGTKTEADVMVTNVLAGGIAGSLAGAITTPLDVIKTRTQLANVPDTGKISVVGTFRDILKIEGINGLFKGWSARAGKAAPACAIVLSAYEMLKFWHPGGNSSW